MKKYTNLFCAIGIITGTLFKYFHFPAANIILVLSSAAAMFSVWFIGFRENKNQQVNMNLNIIMCLTFTFMIMATLYRVMHWPMSDLLEQLSLAGITGLVLLYVFWMEEDAKQISSQFYFIALLLFFLIILLGHKATSQMENQTHEEPTEQPDTSSTDSVLH
jgi:peptidoglycan/LPS O-acetylase OafA/YrhL